MSLPSSRNADTAIFSLFSGDNPAVIADPFPTVAQLRAMGPVVRLPFPLYGLGQGWVITRMDEVVQVLRDHERFTVDPRSLGGQDRFAAWQASEPDAQAAPTSFFGETSMLRVDEPDHRRLRSLVSKVFTPRYMESLRPQVQELSDALIDRVQDQGQMDVVRDYAAPLPINVISEMLGVPEADREQIHVWSKALARGLVGGNHDATVVEHMRAFSAYTAELVAAKRQRPADDLISQLIAIEAEGDRLSEAELLSMIALLIFAGHETTSNLIATGALMLLDRPAQQARLAADLDLVPSAVEELLRFDGPAYMTAPRFATQDTELAGQPIKRGDIVLPVLISANHDEAQFSEPDELDVARKIQRHVAFGQGIHICLGAPLARVEGDIAFTTLLKRLPHMRLAVPRDQIVWHFNLNSRSLAALPVVFDRPPAGA